VPRSVKPPKGLEIRVADKGDLDALVSAMGQHEFFVDRIGHTRQRAGALLVAWLDGAVVGDVYLYCEVQEEPELRRVHPGVPVLNHLEVTPPRQRRGIGTALIRACEAAARERGHDVLSLGVGLDNPDARRLYERLGYHDWGQGPIITRWTEPDGDGGIRHVSLDIDVMMRSLAAPWVEAWAAWQPIQIACRLADVDRPWHVAGGWALDLWHSEQGLGRLREHSDLEIAIPRGAYRAFADALRDLEPYAAHAGAVWPLGDAIPKRHVRQVWMAEEGAYRTDMFLEAGGDRTWVFKRDDRIRRPMGQAVARTRDGIPYLRPEAVLLYKAHLRGGVARPQDEADFAAVSPHLADDEREWLAAALDTVYPNHPWRDALRPAAAGQRVVGGRRRRRRRIG
jgi:GNAT superfamily N-acetyltransferase